MFIVTKLLTWSKLLLDGMLGALKALPGAILMNAPKVHLYTSNTVPKANSQVSDFTEAVFSGYAAQALTLTGPVNIGLTADALNGDVEFVAGSATPQVGATITGYFITDGAGLIYYGGELLGSPVNIANAGDFLHLTVVLPLAVNQPSS